MFLLYVCYSLFFIFSLWNSILSEPRCGENKQEENDEWVKYSTSKHGCKELCKYNGDDKDFSMECTTRL